jgi:phage terminase large subunit
MASLNPELRSFWEDGNGKLVKSRNRVLYGGRASSKSWEFCGRIAHIGQQYKTRILCVRRFQNKIKDSVYTLIKNQINNFGLTGYNVMASEIRHQNGTEFAFYGIERNTDEIKSFEGCDILYIEEAHNLTKEQWEILEPTIRKEGSEIWISFNPDLITDFVYQHFIVNPPRNTVSRLINYPDNKFLSNTLLDTIHEMKEQDFEQYQHVYLGVPRSDDNSAIIKRSWVEAAIDAHLELELDLSGALTVGYDVADSGDDKNAIAKFNGAICEYIEEWKAAEDELAKSSNRAWSFVGSGRLIYDSIGVGAGVGAILKSEGKKNYFKFNAGDAAFAPDKEYAPKITNKQKFENLKAQSWRDVADRLRNTFNAVRKGMKYEASDLISISSDIKEIESLKTELCSPRKDYSKRGLDMVESKKDLAKRGIASPNKADAFIMGACPHLVKLNRARLNIDQ